MVRRIPKKEPKNVTDKKLTKPTSRSLSAAIGFVSSRVKARVKRGVPTKDIPSKIVGLSGAIGAARLAQHVAVKKEAHHKKRAKRQAPTKQVARKLRALASREKELVKKLAEIKRQRRLYKQGFSKREIAARTKKFLKERLDAGRHHGSIMMTALQKSADSLLDYDPSIHVHSNDDGSVDGELTMLAIDTYVAQFRDVALNLPRMRGAWLSPEIYYTPEIEDFYDESDFLIRRGMAGVPIHSGLSMPTSSQWEKPQGITKALTARLLAERIEEGSGFKPTQIVLRLYWSPTGERP